MINEKSAGVIVFRVHPKDGLQYLILYMRGTYWNFPKGKIEDGEGEQKSALRELAEETGIKGLKLAKDWRQETEFFFKEERNGKKELIKKKFIVFLAPVSHKVKVDINNNPAKNEVINGYAWLDYKIANKYLKFKNLKAILAEADSYVRTKIIEAKSKN